LEESPFVLHPSSIAELLLLPEEMSVQGEIMSVFAKLQCFDRVKPRGAAAACLCVASDGEG